jgi:hypothetical protein
MLPDSLDRLVNAHTHDIHPKHEGTEYNQSDKDSIPDPENLLLPDQLFPEVTTCESRNQRHHLNCTDYLVPATWNIQLVGKVFLLEHVVHA